MAEKTTKKKTNKVNKKTKGVGFKQVVTPVDTCEKVGACEYKMPKAIARDYLKGRKGAEEKMDAQAYLCWIVNDQFGLKEKCVKVIIG
jgi:hypothetical protein